MTEKQKRFAQEYLIDCNGTQAAIRAGYSPISAYSEASRLLRNDNVQNYLQAQMAQLQGETVAELQEVLEYTTSVMRGESQSEVMVVEGTGQGMSQAVTKTKAPDEKERLKAAELLLKRYGAGSETSVSVNIPIIIKDDLSD